MSLAVFMMILFMVPNMVFAKSAPATISVKEKVPVFGPLIGDTLQFYGNELTDGRLSYCLDYPKQSPMGQTLKNTNQKLSYGYQYIIENGYPYKKITGDNNRDYYITQVAIYWLHDRKAGVADSKDGMLTAAFKQTESDPYQLRSKIKSLMETALAQEKKHTTSTSIEASANRQLSFSKDKKYFVSSLITVTGSSNMTSYTVSTNTSSKHITILDENGKAKTTFQANEKFYIQIPASELKNKESIDLKITGKFVNKYYYVYQPGDSKFQTITPPEGYEEETTKNTNVSFYPNFSKITIIKKDGTTKEIVEGAKLVLKDKDGVVIDEWVTTSTPHVIDYLPFGEYTLEELSAPDNYVLSKEIIHITTTETDPVKETTMYNQPYIEVPDTSVKSSMVITAFGFIIIALGAGTIYVTKKKAAK